MLKLQQKNRYRQKQKGPPRVKQKKLVLKRKKLVVQKKHRRKRFHGNSILRIFNYEEGKCVADKP